MSEAASRGVSKPNSIRILDVLRKKRDGLELSRAEIECVVRGYTNGDVPDYQAAAWLMAVATKGLSREETANLTGIMTRSGQVLDLSGIAGSKVDKHSSGGVGDKTSLVVAPLAAAGGLVVPMISGRGLGHTGGTLDKLASIPGFSVDLSLARFREVLEGCGCAIVGQTEEIAPADGKFYALRNVTGTVESPFLICASILSKKLAEGLDALVMDVKVGSGAFMKNDDDALFLAGLLVETGTSMGTKVVALITGMDQPLGRCVGNALEVEEAISALRGEGPPDLRELCLELAGWMFHLGGSVEGPEQGKKLAGELLASGKALEKFQKMVAAQGGDLQAVIDSRRLPQAQYKLEVLSPKEGYVTGIRTEDVGTACVLLGGGRESKGSTVDPAVGFTLHKKVSDSVQAGEPLCTIHYNSAARVERVRGMIAQSFEISANPPHDLKPIVRRVITNTSQPRSAGYDRSALGGRVVGRG